MVMIRAAAAAAVFCSVSALATASDFGSAEEAHAMLETTIAAMKADRDGTVTAINSGADPQFKDRDLYPFCGDAAGVFIAHGANDSLVGQSLKDLKDKAGTALGEEMYSSAADGEIVEVAYMWPRPGEEEPTSKISLVTKVGDDVCAVGYYQ